MSKPDPERAPTQPEAVECAFLPSNAIAVRGEDGLWEAVWGVADGRGAETQKRKPGFKTEAEALAHAKKLEIVERLNRC